MRGYIVESVEREYLLCFRTTDLEDLFRIITKLKSSRQKELKGLAAELEEDYYRRLENNKRK